MLFDGLVNLVSRLGTRADKASANTYVIPRLSPDEIMAAYSTTWFGRIVDAKAEDTVREWREWQLETAEKGLVEKVEKTLGIRQKLMQVDIWSMRDGGAALFLGGLPGAPDKPVNWESVGKDALKYVVPLSKTQISTGQRILDVQDPDYNKPENYTVATANGRQLIIHRDRIVRMVGVEYDPAMQADGWGESLWYRLKAVVEGSDVIAAGVASMVQEAKIDVIHIPRLMDNLSTAEYETTLIKRIELAARLKSMVNTLVLDGGKGGDTNEGGETFDTKQLSFANLHDLQDRAMMLMAGMADIPQTRLFGRAPQGMNATGDSDARNYAAMVKARQELKVQPAITNLDRAIVRSALGTEPEGLWYLWSPLYTPTPKESADTEKTYADAFKVRVDTGAIDEEVLSKAERNRMIETGLYPGIEDAIDESDNEGIVDPEEREAKQLERMESEAVIAAQNAPKQITKDAEPRSLYVRRDVVNVTEIRKWAEANGIFDILPDLHVTVVYSRESVDWLKAGNENWNQDEAGRLTVPPGGPRVVEPLGDVTAALQFASTMLQWRHESILRSTGATHDFDEYIPHISLTKSSVDLSTVKPYRGKIVLGPEIFEEVKR